MTRATGDHGPPARSPATRRYLALAILFAAIALAYSNTLSVPLLLDDVPTIAENESIRDLGRIGTVLSSGSVFTQGRPLLNLSFALNHAIGGTGVAGYHVVNLIIHVLAAAVLWGLVAGTLARIRFGEKLGVRNEHVALGAALLWALHPLQVSSVTYLSQRAESLMGLCYLLTLYCFIRGESGPRASWWQVAAVASCWLGTGVKEVIVTAPLACFIFDAVFMSGSVRAAWQHRWRCYLGLAASWVLLAGMMLGSDFERRVIRAGTQMAAEPYAITQVRAVAHYLRLMVWPDPLVFDYGIDQPVFEQFRLGPSVITLIGAVIIAVAGWLKSRRLGVLFVWVFLVLAPTSSIILIAGQRIAENRMYLPSIAGAVLLPVLAVAMLPRRLAAFTVGLTVVAFAMLTWQRNQDYRSPVALWRDTVAKLPGSHRAHGWLGVALLEVPGKYAAAMSHLAESNRLAPWDVDTHWNLGRGLIRDASRSQDAVRCFEVVVQKKPDDAPAQAMLGTALLMGGTRLADAAKHLERAVRLSPGRGDFHRLLGTALLNFPARRAEAIVELETATRLVPADFEAFTNLGIAHLIAPSDVNRAIVAHRAALNVNPRSHLAWHNLGLALLMRGERAEAERSFERALELSPGFEPAGRKLQELRAKK